MLVNDDSSYRTQKPVYEFSLENGDICYIASVTVKADQPPPGVLKILMAFELQGPWNTVLERESSQDMTNE